MARQLKPCGTWAAYQRHRRKGEEPCDACSAAAREQRNGRRAEERRSASEARLRLLESPPVSDPDPLEVARADYELVTATLYGSDVSASSVARLTERREQLVERIRKLNGADKAEVSVLDQLAQRRKDRVANS